MTDRGTAEHLRAEWARLAAQVDELAAAFDEVVAASQDVATDDEHDPEGHTIAFERQQLAALLESAREQVRELDHALERVAAGTYGHCERCGKGIGAERLAARPETRFCVACAT